MGKRQKFSNSKTLRAYLKMCPGLEFQPNGGGHISAVVSGPGGTRKVGLAVTPGDGRTLLNQKTRLRRAAHEVGAVWLDGRSIDG